MGGSYYDILYNQAVAYEWSPTDLLLKNYADVS